jgi:hypothetical protein
MVKGTGIMIDPLSAAAGVVAFITPALIEIGKGGAGKLGGVAAEKLLTWLREKSVGPAREALTDLEAAPDHPDNQADLRKQLAKLLMQEPALLAELRSMLPAAEAGGDKLEQHVTGAGAKGAIVKGHNNNVNM